MTDKKEDKKPRTMTIKGFLHKSQTKAANSASSFLQAHREFLLTGTLAKATYPIIQRIDAGSLMPTPGLEEIRVAALNHMLNREVEEAKTIIEHQDDVQTGKDYIATIYNAKGEVVTYIDAKGEEKEMVNTFDDGEHARGWCDRRLVDGEPTWHGEVTHQKITVGGEPWTFMVERQDSLARILKNKKRPVTTQPKTTTSRLGFGVKAKQDRSSFSRG